MSLELTDSTGALVLAAASVIGLLLIPFGLPGLWVILFGIIGYGWITNFRTLSTGFLVLAIALALLGEVLESWVGFRFAKRYGGSSRAGWGALVGGLVGAVVGVPIPVIGSVSGGFVGGPVRGGAVGCTKGRQGRGGGPGRPGAVRG